jgi:ubiquitin-protein ligase
MSAVRLRRLQSDYERVRDIINRHPRLQLLKTEGNPPEKYQLEYKVRSLRQKDGELLEIGSHVVEIMLPRDYPRTPPLCRMLTPVFHPNIAPHAICIGDHWSAGESLPSLVTRIGEMLAYQSYNTKSPLNGEAAKWVDQNLERLPLDSVNMHLEDTAPAPAAAPAGVRTAPPPPPLPRPAPAARPAPRPAPVAPMPTATAPTARPAPIPAIPLPASAADASAPAMAARIVTCPGCSAKIRAKAELGPQIRCPRCKTIIALT